jgi:hypothetical protein
MFSADVASRQTMGMELVFCKPGQARMQMRVTPMHLNGHQICHGGFIFTLGSFAELGFNEKIMFVGEEILIAARAYTHGFDFFIPDRQYMYHLYNDRNAVFQKNLRRQIWKDYSEDFNVKDKASKQEVYDIFANNIIGPGALGVERTLKEYGDYAGLDFENRKLLGD